MTTSNQPDTQRLFIAVELPPDALAALSQLSNRNLLPSVEEEEEVLKVVVLLLLEVLVVQE